MTTKPVGGRYRKKPVVIYAIQWNGGPYGILDSFCGRNWGRADAVTNGWTCGIPDVEQVVIFNTSEQAWLPVPVGWWIIRGVQGELYSCKSDIFAETYEEVTP